MNCSLNVKSTQNRILHPLFQTQSALEKVSDATGDLLILMAVIAGMTILYFYVIVFKGVYDNHNPDPNKVCEAVFRYNLLMT